MNTIKTLIISIVLLGFINPLFSHKVISEWELAKKADDIELSYRDILIGDTIRTREMQIAFYLKSSPEEIIKMFQNADKLADWAVRTKECRTLQIKEDSWQMYSSYDIPWPLKQRDIITEYKMVKTGDKLTLHMLAKPQLLPYYDNISRIMNYEGYWTFIPLKNGKTKVELNTLSITKPKAPRFIQDPIIQSLFIDSIQKLKLALAE